MTINILHVVGIQNGWAIENRGRMLNAALTSHGCIGYVATFEDAKRLSHDEAAAYDVLHLHGLQIVPLLRRWLPDIPVPWGFEVVSERSLKHVDDVPELICVADFVVAKNPRLAEAIAPAVACEPEYIPNGVDIQTFRPAPIRVGWIGNNRDAAHEEYKGVPLIREAVEQINAQWGHVQFEFVEPPAVYPARVPRRDVAEHLRGLDVFVCASLAEGCSNVVLEALACGLPVVTTNCGIAEELASDGAAVHVTERSAEAIAAKLGDIFSSRLASVSAMRKYQWSAPDVAGKYAAIYRAVAADVVQV